MALSICILAHNEERLLPQTIAAVDAAANGRAYCAHIIVNGSSDGSYGVAKALAAVNPSLRAHHLPLADKANAWNHYVYRLAETADAHIFLDGDIRPSSGAFAALARALEEKPEAYGAAALPLSGRSRRKWATAICLNACLSGNLYALSDDALCAMRAKDIFLPFGAKGEDGLISYLLRTDLKAGRDDSHRQRIAVATEATFEFDPLCLSLRDLRTYHRRLKRYSERHFQKAVLYRLLKDAGLAAMPERIADIYRAENMRGLRPRLDPVNFCYDVVTLKRLKSRERTLKSSLVKAPDS